MIKSDLKKLIVEHISSVHGCKATDLVAACNMSMPSNDSVDINSIIKELVAEKRVVEISYMLPNVKHKKVFYLPGNTKVSI